VTPLETTFLPDLLPADILSGIDSRVLIRALLGFLFGIVLIRILSWLGQGILGVVRLPKGLRGILTSIMDALLWVGLFVWFLDTLNLDKLAIVFSGSIAAVGLALAGGASSLAADILAGIFLAKDRDFSVGDEVIAGENKTEGIIESMDMRRTRIRAKDGNLHVIPNSIVERKEWILLNKKREITERKVKR
jgi:small-conductance mechanosensitive channel